MVEIHIDGKNIRVINAYGPQVIDSIERKTKFWCRIQDEIREAQDNGISIILQMDGNLHAGSDIIKDDPNPINLNGKLFAQFLKNNPSLFLVNASDKCQGIITRQRVKGKKTEEAILDFVLVSEDLKSPLQELKIDTDRKYPLCSFLKGKQKNSDHFTLNATFDIKFRKQKPERVEMFNFKSSVGLSTFKFILDTENSLSECFNNNDDCETQVENWCIKFNKILQRSFRKVRITDKQKETPTSILFTKRAELIQKSKKDRNNTEILAEIEAIEDELATLVAKENRDKIFETFAKLDQSEEESFSNGLWKLKKRSFPKKGATVPAAKRDITGRTITDPNGLKQLYKETFTHRLRSRPSKKSTADLYELQEILLKKRLVLTEDERTPEWSRQDVMNVMKSLKKNKARDPLGWVNELFRLENAGEDLIQSIRLLVNRVKQTQVIPTKLSLRDVTPIFKNRGSRQDIENERGVFNGTILNSIVQKLIYKDIYPIVDENLTDSNVGARKGRGVRNHSFMLNSVIHLETSSSKSKSGVNLIIGDYKVCFDALSLPITTNDLFNAGIDNSHLNLLYKSDETSNISIKTPFGKTERFLVKNTIPQGDVPAPFKCTTSVDSISEDQSLALENHLYQYKNKVKLPPFGMIDDQLIIAKCGLGSALASAHLNSMTNIKKLQFGAHKTVKMHIGNKNINCPQNFIDTFELKSTKEKVSSILDMVDVESEKHVMKTVTSWKYLGDIMQSNGKCDLNILDKVGKGLGAIEEISQMLSDLCLGPYMYESFIVLRRSLFLGTLLANCEAWVGLTKKNIQDLEAVDEQLLRSIFSSDLTKHSKAPIELLYLETGTIPIRFTLMSRRLNFLWYLLNQNEDSMLGQFFRAQCDSPTRGDWVSSVQQDMHDLELEMTFDQIKAYSQEAFKDIVRKHVRISALTMLTQIQQTHSKSKKMQYNDLKMQNYLSSENKVMTIKEKVFAFTARAHMLELKGNFKAGKTNINCSLGCDKVEDQKHIFECPVLEVDVSEENIEYDNIYLSDQKKIRMVTQRLMKRLERGFRHQCHLHITLLPDGDLIPCPQHSFQTGKYLTNTTMTDPIKVRGPNF